LRIDLHSHSTHSDGLLRPAELVMRAASRGVEVLALTDHDATSGLAEARAQAADAGMRLIDGVEISVTWNEHTIHVLGLHVNPDDPELTGGLSTLRKRRNHRADAMAAELERLGVGGSLEGARRYVTNPELVGRAHFARFLVERGHARDVQTVFKKYLAVGKPGYVPQPWARLSQAMRWINASGGMAVLAHPARYRLNGAEREALFGEFRDAGGVGVEVVTSSHTVAQYDLYARYAYRYGLLASVGSDFHGPEESRCELGGLPELPSGCTPIWTRF
jgi:predicted metal-dependent phosphoesterase TrpH